MLKDEYRFNKQKRRWLKYNTQYFRYSRLKEYCYFMLRLLAIDISDPCLVSVTCHKKWRARDISARNMMDSEMVVKRL